MKFKLADRMWETARMKRCHLAECKAACCLHGVWMDLAERAVILKNVEQILPFMPRGQHDPSVWWDDRIEADEFMPSGKVVHTSVLTSPDHYGGTACVFLRNDSKCALQVAGEQAGYHPWRFKPFYCVLHPLDLDDDGRITLDETDALLEEPASCLRACDQPTPLLVIFAEELRYLLGENAYQWALSQHRG